MHYHKPLGRYALALTGIAIAVGLAGLGLSRYHVPPPPLPVASPKPALVPAKVLPLDQQWRSLYQTSSCLTGGQDWSPEASEGCVLATPPWRAFLARPQGELVPFLLQRLSSQKTTHVHTCPYQPAREGELAVYALQHALQVNYTGAPSQEALWERLQTQNGREQIKSFFRTATRRYTSPLGLGDEGARRYQVTIPEGWELQSLSENAPDDEAEAREGIAELHLRKTSNHQEVILVRVVEANRVHPRQGLALAFQEVTGDTHLPIAAPWKTDHGVDGEVFKAYQPDGQLVGYKIVSPSCHIGYLDISTEPRETSSVTQTELRQLAQVLWKSFRLLTPQGTEVKD